MWNEQFQKIGIDWKRHIKAGRKHLGRPRMRREEMELRQQMLWWDSQIKEDTLCSVSGNNLPRNDESGVWQINGLCWMKQHVVFEIISMSQMTWGQKCTNFHTSHLHHEALKKGDYIRHPHTQKPSKCNKVMVVIKFGGLFFKRSVWTFIPRQNKNKRQSIPS